jgi:hypothetical protein
MLKLDISVKEAGRRAAEALQDLFLRWSFSDFRSGRTATIPVSIFF